VPVRTMRSGVSSSVLAAWALATGGSLTGVTMIETAAGADVVVPSSTVKLKPSLPLKSAAGVYVTCALDASIGVIADRDPNPAGVAMANARLPPSTSLPTRVISTGASSSVLADCGIATGASSTAVTVTVTLAGAEAPLPSATVKLKLSPPLKSAAGV